MNLNKFNYPESTTTVYLYVEQVEDQYCVMGFDYGGKHMQTGAFFIGIEIVDDYAEAEAKWLRPSSKWEKVRDFIWNHWPEPKDTQTGRHGLAGLGLFAERFDEFEEAMIEHAKEKYWGELMFIADGTDPRRHKVYKRFLEKRGYEECVMTYTHRIFGIPMPIKTKGVAMVKFVMSEGE